jgi:hypothetical protein
MKITTLLLIPAILFLVFTAPFVIRAYARTRADKIINGKQPASEKYINRLISALTWTNGWILDGSNKDRITIERLRDMLKEMLHPHG